MEAANLPVDFSKIWKREKVRYLCYLCQKIIRSHETGGEAGAKLQAVPPGRGLKPPLHVGFVTKSAILYLKKQPHVQIIT